jgi:hypothetical protein
MEKNVREASLRGQAAIEFIVTYAWVILIVSVILVLVWQLGLLDLGGTIAPGSMGFWGVTPSDFKVTGAGELTVSLSNYVGANVTLVGVAANQSVYSVAVPLALVLEPGGNASVVVPGLMKGKGGSRFDVLLRVDYVDSRTGNQHRSSGRIWGSYES